MELPERKKQRGNPNRCPNCSGRVELFAKECVGCNVRHCMKCRYAEAHACSNMEAVRQRDLDRLKQSMPQKPVVAAKV